MIDTNSFSNASFILVRRYPVPTSKLAYNCASNYVCTSNLRGCVDGENVQSHTGGNPDCKFIAGTLTPRGCCMAISQCLVGKVRRQRRFLPKPMAPNRRSTWKHVADIVVRCSSASIGECLLSQKSPYTHDEDTDPRLAAPCREVASRRDV